MYITSNMQLSRIVTTAVHNALQEVIEKGYQLLQDEITSAGIPAHGDGLWNAWEKTCVALSASIEYDPSNLALVQAPFPHGRHGSALAGRKGGNPPSDVRQGFAEIIFEGLAPINPRLGQAGGTHPAKDAWTPFLESFANQLSGWFISAMAAQGFVVS